jgi:hypothetical protein
MAANGILPRSTWGIWAYTRYEADRDELDRLPQAARKLPDYEIADKRLEEARRAVVTPYGRRAFSLFYSGARIEQAWSAIHEAERAMINLFDAEVLRGRIPLLRTAVNAHLRAGDPERGRALRYLDDLEKPGREITDGDRKGLRSKLGLAHRSSDEKPGREITHGDRERLRSILGLAHRSSDETNRQVRGFRNLWLVFALLLGAVLCVVGLVHVFDHSLISLCSNDVENLKDDLCPGGGDVSGRFDVFEVELLGAVGGLLAAVMRLAKSRKMPGPYGVSVALNALKIVAGGGTALLGVLLLQKGLFVGLPAQEGSKVIAYAALFGFAQQAFTTLVDQRASKLAESSTPGEEAADGSSAT